MNGLSKETSSSAIALALVTNGDSSNRSIQEQHQQQHTTIPKLRIGVVADIQYADVDDGFSWSGNPRYYRHALDSATAAARRFQEETVDVVVNLGDTVDGKANRDPLQLDQVIGALHHNYSYGKIIHVYGNHCLYNADRQTLQEKLGISMTCEADGELVGYYSHIVGDTNIRLVVLDSYDVCYLREKHSAKHMEAVETLKRHNRENYENSNHNSCEGLEDLQKRFVGFNGAIGKTQLEWLATELQSARELDHQVILLSHQPILPGTTNPVCLIWNYEQVLDTLKTYKDVVVASLSGHAHKYGYAAWHGIHFRVFEAVLETPRPHHTYCILDVYEDRLQVNGYGECQSATYEYAPRSSV